MRRLIVGVVVMTLGALLAACGGGSDVAETDEQATQLAATLPITVQPTQVELSGSGPSVTEPFNLQAGLAVIDFTYSGPADKETNFFVRLNHANATYADDVANELNAGGGETVVTVPSDGSYVLEVQQASGPWTLTVQQPPTGPENAALPHGAGGSQPSVLRWLTLDAGAHRITSSFTGAHEWSTLIVTVWSEDGNYSERVVDQLPSGTKEATADMAIPRAGRYLLEVAAEIGSDWQVTVTKP